MDSEWVLSIMQTEWAMGVMSPKNQEIITHRFEYAVRYDLLRAAYPPSSFDAQLFTCLFHKTEKGRMRFILFPDDYDLEHLKDAKDTANDLLDILVKKRNVMAEITDVKVCKNQHEFAADSKRYPIYFDIKMQINFDRPVAEIIGKSQEQVQNEKIMMLQKMAGDTIARLRK